MQTLTTTPGNNLTDAHYAQLTEASRREFGMGLPPKAELGERLFFLNLDTETGIVLSSGYLKRIYPVCFGEETVSFVNIGNVIASEKGKGYGKQLMAAMSAYLREHDLTGLGFCMPYNEGFYEKCGYAIERHATPRFIYLKGDQRITEPMGQYILYLESSERLVERILARPDLEIFVPEDTIW